MFSIPGIESPLHLREAVSADLPRLAALINTAFSIESFIGGTRTDDENLAEQMEKGSILFAEDGAGRPLASVYVERRGMRGYMGMLAVDPAHQGKGLAHRMVETAEERFRQQGCEAVDIVVLNLRSELLPIYRRFGYVETGTEAFHSPRPLRPGVECHCIVMSKQL
ncbi:MAG: GNAT family N-acetyltransferase [Terracidiphilus sp.]|nr:GNAT family N-acetyltransferase [Terracidiphilus sp.]